MWLRPVFALAALCGVQAPVRAQDAQDLAIPEAVADVLAETCFDCHTGRSAKAGFDLERLSARTPREWLGAVLHVRDRVRSREMPPSDWGALDADEIEPFVAWADAELARRLNPIDELCSPGVVAAPYRRDAIVVVPAARR